MNFCYIFFNVTHMQNSFNTHTPPPPHLPVNLFRFLGWVLCLGLATGLVLVHIEDNICACSCHGLKVYTYVVYSFIN